MITLPENSKISITGDLGSGKSTVARIIKERYGYIVYSTGAVQRSLAQKYGMTTLEFNKYMESHPEIDEEIDTQLTETGKQPGRIVIDSRMAWHFVPHSFKVYLSVSPETAAARIMKAQRGNVESYTDLEDAKEKLLARKASENLRYSQKYGVDCSNMDNFDLVLDMTDATPEEGADTIINELNKLVK